MPRRTADPAVVAVEDQPKKRKTENGCRLPDAIREGEILTDITKNQWKLGKSIGVGGFGEIYLASKTPCKTVGPDAQHVIKIEPHMNGPLFVEKNFYVRVARPDMIEEWKKEKSLKHLGMSPYLGSGSHVYKGEKYRFLVLKRFGQDLGKLFLKNGRRFPVKTSLYLGLQVLDILEYIHSHGYAHSDIKGPNLLLGYNKGTENNIYLLDFGLAVKYRMSDGTHREYRCDERRAHDGTLEYTSRDAHIGAHSRRGDMEVLGYNILQWLCGRLPWESYLEYPEQVHQQKKTYMSNIPLLMRRCFPSSEPPAVLSQYLRYVASLGYQTKPDYAYCRNIFLQGIKDAGYVNDQKLVFVSSPALKIKKKGGRKRKSIEEPENIVEMKPKKIIRTAWRQPCVAHNFNRMTRNSLSSPVLRSHHQFNWEKIISGNPEKSLKKVVRKVAGPGKLDQGIAVHRPVKKLKLQSIPENQEPVRPSSSTGVDSLENPTPAMLEIISKRHEKATVTSVGARKTKAESRCCSPLESPYPFTITRAMELVIQRREELRQLEKEDEKEDEHEDEHEDDNTICLSDGDNISDNHSYVMSCSMYSSDEEDNKEFFKRIRFRPQKSKKSKASNVPLSKTKGNKKTKAHAQKEVSMPPASKKPQRRHKVLPAFFQNSPIIEDQLVSTVKKKCDVT